MPPALADVVSEHHDDILLHVANVADRLRLGRQLRRRCIGPAEVDSQRRIPVACQRLCRPAPSAIEQCHGCANSLAWIGESVDEGGNGLGRVLASERLDVERSFWPATRITGLTWRPRTADDLCVHHSAVSLLF
jgi:hypothetical protein